MSAGPIYDFVFRGHLAEEALNRAGRRHRNFDGLEFEELARILCLDRFDEVLVMESKRMAVVYVAIASFEGSVRQLITRVLLEQVGEDWWNKCVSEKIRQRAEVRMAEEQKVKWHTRRGTDPINYTMLPDLLSVVRSNWERFQPYFDSAEWVASVFDVIERSRNVIMHSGRLEREDIERVGINLRDWIKQVGV